MDAPRKPGLRSDEDSKGEYFSTVKMYSFKTERVGVRPSRGPMVSLQSQINFGMSRESCMFQANLMNLGMQNIRMGEKIKESEVRNWVL